MAPALAICVSAGARDPVSSKSGPGIIKVQWFWRYRIPRRLPIPSLILNGTMGGLSSNFRFPLSSWLAQGLQMTALFFNLSTLRANKNNQPISTYAQWTLVLKMVLSNNDGNLGAVSTSKKSYSRLLNGWCESKCVPVRTTSRLR